MSEPIPDKKKEFSLNEDWISVFLAFLLILLAAIGALGEAGIQVKF